MPKSSIQADAIQAVMAINTAIRNLRLYPSGNPMIQDALDKVHRSISLLLSQTDQVVFAEAEKVLIIDDQPLNEKILQRPQVRAFLDTMIELGVHTLSLQRGLGHYELQVFLELLNGEADEIAAAGGVATLVKRRHLPHIRIDEKRFVALDKGQRIAPAQATAEDEQEAASTAAQTGMADTPGTGPQGVSRVLYSGLQPFADLAQGGRSAETQAVFDQLLAGLADLSAGSGSGTGGQNGSTGLGLDPEAFTSLLNQSFASEPDNSSPAVESLFAQIKTVVQTHLRNGRYPSAARILEALNGAAAKSACPAGMRNLVRTLMESIAEESLLHALLKDHLEGSPASQPAIARILRLLMPAAADFMLERLRVSNIRRERSHLMRLLPELGVGLRGPVLQRIGNGGPWYYLRNLASLLGKIACPEDLPVFERLLANPDPRVQREALGGLYTVEDEGRGEILFRFLPNADESLRLNVVTLLGALAYQPAAAPLMAILESWTPRYPKAGEALAEKICVALGRIGDPVAIPALAKILEPHGLFSRGPGEQVESAARQALALIRANPGPNNAASKPAPPSQPPRPASSPPATEAEIDRLAAAGDSETAGSYLLAMITAAAKAKRFAEAERLHEKLYEIDALALGPIIQAGEIIEAEKSRAIDPDHIKIFAPLYTQLTEADRNALYHAMTSEDFPPGDTLVHQGRINNRLCLINQGTVKIVHRQGSREMLIDRPQAGSIVGGDSFFRATVSTVAVIAMGPVAATCLARDVLEKLHPDHPGLKSKLQDHVVRQDTIAEQLRCRGMDRRRHPRYQIQGRVKVQIQDRQARAVGRPFLGALCDCSKGGIAFCIGSANSETARILLGRRLQLEFAIPLAGAPRKVSTCGTVIGVNDLMANEYSLHIRFDQNLDPETAEALAKTAS